MTIEAGPNIVTDGLVLHLDAANTKSYPGSGTTWTDVSGTGNNGTLTASPTFNSANNGSFSFNGSTQYVVMGDKFNTASGTIACWITVDNNITSSNALNYRICGKTTDYEFRFFSSGSDPGISNGSLGADLGASRSIYSNKRDWTANQWYYVVLTWNQTAGTSSIYIDGILDVTGTSTNMTGQITDSFDIGRSGTRGYLAGKISLFKIYNTVLTEAQVEQNFNATRGRYGI